MILILVLSKADIMKGPLKQQRIAMLLKSTPHIKVVNTKHMSMEFQVKTKKCMITLIQNVL